MIRPHWYGFDGRFLNPHGTFFYPQLHYVPVHTKVIMYLIRRTPVLLGLFQFDKTITRVEYLIADIDVDKMKGEKYHVDLFYGEEITNRKDRVGKKKDLLRSSSVAYRKYKFSFDLILHRPVYSEKGEDDFPGETSQDLVTASSIAPDDDVTDFITNDPELENNSGEW